MKNIKHIAKLFLATESEALKNALRVEAMNQMKGLEFETMGKAKKQIGLSYLGSINSSAKIVKNAKKNYDTYIVYLAPYNTSGHNTCAKASEGCVKACLNTSGRVKMDVENNILTARLIKTWLFYANREFYSKWVFAEIKSAKTRSASKGHKFSVRLNGTSDLSLETIKVDGTNVLEAFKGVQFYDYTKVFNRLERMKKYDNYHLTFSYSGENMDET